MLIDWSPLHTDQTPGWHPASHISLAEEYRTHDATTNIHNTRTCLVQPLLEHSSRRKTPSQSDGTGSPVAAHALQGANVHTDLHTPEASSYGPRPLPNTPLRPPDAARRPEAARPL